MLMYVFSEYVYNFQIVTQEISASVSQKEQWRAMWETNGMKKSWKSTLLRQNLVLYDSANVHVYIHTTTLGLVTCSVNTWNMYCITYSNIHYVETCLKWINFHSSSDSTTCRLSSIIRTSNYIQLPIQLPFHKCYYHAYNGLTVN